jgi:hypothetical protein
MRTKLILERPAACDSEPPVGGRFAHRFEEGQDPLVGRQRTDVADYELGPVTPSQPSLTRRCALANRERSIRADEPMADVQVAEVVGGRDQSV